MIMPMSQSPSICAFEHPGFAALKDPLFRLTEGDRVAALAIKLDGAEAVVPLKAVAKLFNIQVDSPDGRMLHLIQQGLRFVVCLRPGDALPTEVLSGEASWRPSAYHCQIASARLQLQLVDWIGGAEDAQGRQITSQMLVVSVDDPSIRPRVQEALRRAAEQLGIEGGGPAVAALIEELAGELAYVEALRERLLLRAQSLAARLVRLAASPLQLSAARRETLFQVTRLANVGIAEMTARFDEVDAQTGEIIAALRNLEQQRSFLRSSRDWLYCTQMAWDAELRAWEGLSPSDAGERTWKLLDKLYRFLAPRHMAVQEWQSMTASAGGERARAALVW